MNIGSFWDFRTTRFNHQKAEVCKTLADSTLFYCSPLFGIHHNLSVRKLSLSMALCSITNMYMWYWYITIYIAIMREQ